MCSLTPSTTVTSSFLAGAEMMTFLTVPAQVLAGLRGVGEFARGFDDNLHAQRIPGQLGGILDGKDANALAIHDNAIPFGFYLGLERAEHRIILQEVGQSLGVREVVCRDPLDIRVVQTGAQDVAPDPAETVDSDFNWHAYFLLDFCAGSFGMIAGHGPRCLAYT
jgi:hypothetical protein